jgi:hypothetical protein
MSDKNNLCPFTLLRRYDSDNLSIGLIDIPGQAAPVCVPCQDFTITG